MGGNKMNVLETRNLSKVYGDKGNENYVKALDKINIAIEEGEFVGIMGPSGSGKTTLLNILATIDSPSSGEVLINGNNPHKLDLDELAVFRRRKLGFIFQEFNLLDTLSLKENIILPLVLDKMGEKEINTKLKEVTQTLGIDNKKRVLLSLIDLLKEVG